jgi:hypothetical protein
VRAYTFVHASGRTVRLLDTPGFDDTTRSDAEILKEIVYFLNKVYQAGFPLLGIVYLHRITDPRMSGSAIKNLEIFKKLCGEAAFPNVRLVTTRWNQVKPGDEELKEAREREAQLIQSERYWAPMLKHGAAVRRHTGDAQSAHAIVGELIAQNQKRTLAIQREMIEDKTPLDRTTAGQLVLQEYDEMRRKYEVEMKELQESKREAIREKDQDGFAALQAQEQEFQALRQRAMKDQKGLQITFAALEEQKAKEVVARIGKWEAGEPRAAQSADIRFLEHNLAELEDRFERQEKEHKAQMAEMRRKARAQTAEQKRFMDEQIRQRDQWWQAQSMQLQAQIQNERLQRERRERMMEMRRHDGGGGGGGIGSMWTSSVAWVKDVFTIEEPRRHRRY